LNRHFTPAALTRILDGTANEAEIVRAIRHLLDCDSCWATAADCLPEARSETGLRATEARAAFKALVGDKTRSAVESLEAEGRWADLRDLSPAEQLLKIRSIAALRSLPLFEVILDEARTVGRSDPFLGECTARVALLVADNLPEPPFMKALKDDLRGEVWTVIANCCRIAADWTGSAEALATARRYLKQGTGDPGLEGQLLSIHASYCTDTGDFEKALTFVRRAAEIFRELKDAKGVAHNLVKEANTLLAAYEPAEAIEKAKSALQDMPRHDLRLQTFARFIVVEGLVLLGRPHDALVWFLSTKPLVKEIGDLGTKLRAVYCQARLLDGLGYLRESEKLFRNAIKAYFDHELYKEAFITLLTLFECFCRRGALGKAAALCESAIAATSEAGEACNEEICRAWKELLATVRVRQLDEAELVAARQYLVRNWSVARGGAFVLAKLAAAEPEVRVAPIPPPIPQTPEEAFGYPAALAAYERQLIESALQETGGSVAKASRLLGLSRNGLKGKIRRYGL
jgi:tetratricopeptide (TPR) repeat protein